jgi:hypothetical protein
MTMSRRSSALSHESCSGTTELLPASRRTYRALTRLFLETKRIWRQWLSRRSQKGFVSWPAMARLLERFPLPKPRTVHRYGT